MIKKTIILLNAIFITYAFGCSCNGAVTSAFNKITSKKNQKYQELSQAIEKLNDEVKILLKQEKAEVKALQAAFKNYKLTLQTEFEKTFIEDREINKLLLLIKNDLNKEFAAGNINILELYSFLQESKKIMQENIKTLEDTRNAR